MSNGTTTTNGTATAPAQPAAVKTAAQKGLKGLIQSFVHGNDQTTAIQRAAVAQSYGLNPSDYVSQFPATNKSSTSTINNTTGLDWKGLAAVAALVLGAGGGAYMLSKGTPAAAVAPANPPTNPPVTNPPATNTTPVTPQPATNPVAPATNPVTPVVTPPKPVQLQPLEYDEVEEVQQPDGSYKPTGNKVRKRLNPDGSIDQLQPDGKTWKQVLAGVKAEPQYNFVPGK